MADHYIKDNAGKTHTINGSSMDSYNQAASIITRIEQSGGRVTDMDAGLANGLKILNLPR